MGTVHAHLSVTQPSSSCQTACLFWEWAGLSDTLGPGGQAFSAEAGEQF